MAQVEGLLTYARGRVFPLTVGSSASILNTTLKSYNIPREECAYGTFNGKEYMCSVLWYASGSVEDPNAATPSTSTGLLKCALITTTPRYPKGVMILYFLPYAASTGVIGSPRFLYYGPNFTTRGYWAVVNSYTSNNAVLAGKYLFERDSSAHKFKFTNSTGVLVTPYRTGALPIDEVHNIVGTGYKYLIYYLPLT